MDEQGSYEGFSPGAYGAPSSANPQPPAVTPAPFVAAALRPLSTGEVLDRTFVLYRRRFWLFAGIGMVPAGLLTLISMMRLILVKASQVPVAPTAGAPTDALAKAISGALLMQAYFLPATLLFVLIYGISNAATVHAVLQITTGMATSAASAYRAVRAHWLRWTGIALRQFWSAFWPFLPATAFIIAVTFAIPGARATAGFAVVGLLIVLAILSGIAGVVFGVINLLRTMLAMPASVQEGFGVNAAVRRSRVLVAGRKGRIFLLLLLVYVLQIVAGSIQLPLVLIAMRSHGAQQILLGTIELLITFAATTVVGPVLSIALCLFYIDERVRREGYDIELLMQRSFAAPGIATTTAEAQPLA